MDLYPDVKQQYALPVDDEADSYENEFDKFNEI